VRADIGLDIAGIRRVDRDLHRIALTGALLQVVGFLMQAAGIQREDADRQLGSHDHVEQNHALGPEAAGKNRRRVEFRGLAQQRRRSFAATVHLTHQISHLQFPSTCRLAMRIRLLTGALRICPRSSKQSVNVKNNMRYTFDLIIITHILPKWTNLSGRVNSIVLLYPPGNETDFPSARWRPKKLFFFGVSADGATAE
jgi:hypothetical protein